MGTGERLRGTGLHVRPLDFFSSFFIFSYFSLVLLNLFVHAPRLCDPYFFIIPFHTRQIFLKSQSCCFHKRNLRLSSNSLINRDQHAKITGVSARNLCTQRPCSSDYLNALGPRPFCEECESLSSLYSVIVRARMCQSVCSGNANYAGKDDDLFSRLLFIIAFVSNFSAPN